jgi:hypothetical protein
LEEIVAQQVAKDTGLEVVKGWAIALQNLDRYNWQNAENKGGE